MMRGSQQGVVVEQTPTHAQNTGQTAAALLDPPVHAIPMMPWAPANTVRTQWAMRGEWFADILRDDPLAWWPQTPP